MTAELVAFLRARLDEDEAVARQAEYDRIARRDHAYSDAGLWLYRPGGVAAVCAHLARVLADTAAKRAIVDLAAEVFGVRQDRLSTGYEIHQNDGAREVMDATLRHLAAPYSMHPDYRQEWKP